MKLFENTPESMKTTTGDTLCNFPNIDVFSHKHIFSFVDTQ